MKKFIFILLVGLFFIGCGGDSSSSSESDTSVWNVKGKYYDCDNFATGKFEFISENGKIEKVVYTGEDWYDDCSVKDIGTVSYDISNLNLSEPLDKDEVYKLIQYIYAYNSGSDDERWDIAVNQIDDALYFIEAYDNSVGNMELIEMQQQTYNLTSNDINYTGTYKGTYSGDDEGTLEFTIKDDGNISGFVYSNIYGTLTLHGILIEDGIINFDVLNDLGDINFAGMINEDGIVYGGSWSNAYGFSGSFTAQKQ
jgi:hypothetical protein